MQLPIPTFRKVSNHHITSSFTTQKLLPHFIPFYFHPHILTSITHLIMPDSFPTYCDATKQAVLGHKRSRSHNYRPLSIIVESREPRPSPVVEVPQTFTVFDCGEDQACGHCCECNWIANIIEKFPTPPNSSPSSPTSTVGKKK